MFCNTCPFLQTIIKEVYIRDGNGTRQVSSTPVTIVATSVTPAISDPDYEELGSTPVDEWEWEKDYEVEKTP